MQPLTVGRESVGQDFPVGPSVRPTYPRYDPSAYVYRRRVVATALSMALDKPYV